MISPFLYGLNAGLGMSPHTLGSILTAMEDGKLKGYSFLLGGLFLDLTLILLTYTLGSGLKLNHSQELILLIFSGIITLRMGLKVFHSKGAPMLQKKKINSFSSGFLIQTFNPNPYMFWIAIGLPTMMSATSRWKAMLFCIIFLSVTYVLKLVILEISVRASTLRSSPALSYVRKAIAMVTIASGVYLIIHNAKGFL